MSSSKQLRVVRRLRAADAATFRPVLLEALIIHPDCFSENYSNVLTRPVSDTESDLESSGTFGFWVGTKLVGIGVCVTRAGVKRRHGSVQILYVKKQYREKGIGTRLLEAIVEYSEGLMEPLEVNITKRDEHVVRLFKQHQFRMYGPCRSRIMRKELDVWTMFRSMEIRACPCCLRVMEVALLPTNCVA